MSEKKLCGEDGFQAEGSPGEGSFQSEGAHGEDGFQTEGGHVRRGQFLGASTKARV